MKHICCILVFMIQRLLQKRRNKRGKADAAMWFLGLNYILHLWLWYHINAIIPKNKLIRKEMVDMNMNKTNRYLHRCYM